MKLLAQHGFSDGDKILNGLKNDYIDGVIFSPKDIKKKNLEDKLSQIRNDNSLKEKIILFDSQFYSLQFTNKPNFNFGNLETYNYAKHIYTKSDLEIEKNVEVAIRNTLSYQTKRSFDFIISPNINISKRFDSIDGSISKKFIRLSRNVYSKMKERRPLYATLSISSEALADHNSLFEFLNDLTILKDRPDGFYILISSRDIANDIYNFKVIAGWLLLNYSLKINGFKIINGYSDLISPLLASVGADYGATGWFSNLRSFSIKRFFPDKTGGRQPIQRYLSKVLWNRITHIEFNNWKKRIPIIKNGLDTDKYFDLDIITSEPDRKTEVLQHWETLSKMIDEYDNQDINKNLQNCETILKNAIKVYQTINLNFSPDQKSSGEHLESLLESIITFRKLAEL